ncbi:hypothetical protein [Listeria cornellensis]|uniref:Uncharacterized protein n=1 Tax=Listeria cornellensis FSL F6-0969 TaxID=1265820 RepID=W7BHB1_9LIST|nr:hypothetical protein [Listeria cornellensis]EUJ26459.1 hypothetical protein PCORN_14854 [Listeria cornellensis FSL F6-0969]
MNKKLIISIVCIVGIVIAGILIYNNTHSKEVASLIRVDDTNFVPTNEPADEASTGDFIGKISKRLDRESTPTKNNESNSLDLGTKLYKFNGDNQPTKVIVYEEDGSKYIARENVINE